MNVTSPPRHVWLCADDYGISPGVNRAIRELIDKKRINATSVMVVGPATDSAEIDALKASISNNPDCAIGLHTTLTAPFNPLTMHFKPLDGGQFLPLAKLLRTGLMRQLDREIIHSEIAAQLAAFKNLFGRKPDYADGHQHVQLFPQIRDAFLSAVKDAAPGAWVRQCGRTTPLAQRFDKPKALLLDILSYTFRAKCIRAGVRFNPGFAGAYDFSSASDFGRLLPNFFNDLPDGGLVMCHPGFVDDTLIALDPLTHQRENEYAYLAGEQFPRVLAERNLTLSRPF